MPKTSAIPVILLLTASDRIIVVAGPSSKPVTGAITVENFLQYVQSDIRLYRASGVDGRYDIYINNSLVGAFWYDDSLDNLVIENDRSNGRIVINHNSGEVHVYNDATDETTNIIDEDGNIWTILQSADPSYVDGYGAIYPYSSGGETRFRGVIKDGATEKTVDLVDKDDVEDFGINFIIGNGAEVIDTGVAGYIEMPFAGEFESVSLLPDQSGSIVIDLWKDTYANYPPTVADTITASAKPTISSATKSQDTTLSGWTKTFAKGDILGINVDSCTTIEQCTLSLKGKRTL